MADTPIDYEALARKAREGGGTPTFVAPGTATVDYAALAEKARKGETAPSEPEPHRGSASTPGVLGVGVDLLRGMGSGVISTGVGAYELARKIPGAADVLPPTSEYWKAAAEAPDSIAGKAGKFGEQATEMMIPMSKVATAAKALPAAARVAAEAAAAGGIAGVQSGGDLKSAALAAGTQGLFSGAGAALSNSGVTKSLSELLKDSAKKEYAQVLLRGGGTVGNKVRTERIVPELINRGETALTLQGLSKKAGANIQSAGQAIGDAFDSLPADARIDVGTVEKAIADSSDKAFRVLNQSTGELVPMSAEAEHGIAHVNGILDSLGKVAEVDPKTGERFITADNARRIRQFYDKVTKEAGGFEGKTLADRSTAGAHQMAADAIREELAAKFPDIAKINKEYSFWKDVAKVADDTILRKQGHGKGLGTTVMGAAGAAAGASHGVPGIVMGKQAMEALAAATKSTAWRTVDAVMKDRLANALAKGQRGEAERIIRNIGAVVSSATARNRTTEPEKEQ